MAAPIRIARILLIGCALLLAPACEKATNEAETGDGKTATANQKGTSAPSENAPADDSADGGVTAPAPDSAAAPPPPLEIADEDLVAGVKDGRLLLIINVFPNKAALDAMPPERAVAALTAAALRETAAQIFSEEYKDLPGARVELIELADMDEYGEANWSNIAKLGSMTIEKEANRITVLENNITKDGAKGITGASLALADFAKNPSSQTDASDRQSSSSIATDGTGADAGRPAYLDDPAYDPSIHAPEVIVARRAVFSKFPAEKDEIMAILRSDKPVSEKFAAIRPLYSAWAPDYEAVLRLILASGYRIVPYEEFDPNRLDEKICYMSHDIHHRDIEGAACMMDIENKVGARSTYYIHWDYSPWARAHQADWAVLAPMAEGRHRFGLHASYASERLEWMEAKGPNDTQGLLRALPEFVALPEYPRISNGPKVLVPDPDWPAVKVFPEIGMIEDPLLREIVSYGRRRFSEELESMRAFFGRVETFASHGCALHREASRLVEAKRCPPHPWHCMHMLTQKLMRDNDVLNERYHLHFGYGDQFPYASDSSRIQEFDECLNHALAQGGAFGVLVHPALWMRSFCTEARLYDLAPQSRRAIIAEVARLEGPKEAPKTPKEYAKDAPYAPIAGKPIAGLRQETSEQVVFDEMDFYDHPRYMGNTYPAFVPERVRRIDAFYYYRAADSESGQPFEQSTSNHVGQILLRAESGALLYLPQDISSANLIAISFWYKKSDPDGQCYFRFYRSSTETAIVGEGDVPGFPAQNDESWHKVYIPFDALRFSEGTPHPDKLEKGQALHAFKYLDAEKDVVYGIEIGMRNSAPGKSLLIDKLVLHRPPVTGRILNGSVEPVVEGLDITVRTPERALVAKTDAQGKFEIDLPPEATRYEAVTRYRNIWYAPTAGRYFEAGRNAYLPSLRFELRNERETSYKGDAAWFRYEYSTDRGITYQPCQYFLYLGAKDKEGNRELFVETSSNEFGYIDKDRWKGNPDKNFRVVIMGACYIAGHQISSMENVAAQVESILRFRGRQGVEVLRVSHNTLVLLASWPALKNHALEWKPDVVLMNVASPVQLRTQLLDLHAMERGYDPQHPESYHFRLDDKTGELVHIPHDPDFRLYRTNAPAKPDGHPDNWAGVKWSKDILREDWSQLPDRLRESMKLYQAGIKMFTQEARNNGVELALLFGSDIGGLQDGVFEENGVKYDNLTWRRFVQDTADQAGARFIDGMTYVKTQATDESGAFINHWPINGHWSPAGHRFVAEAIADEIEKILDKKP